MGKTSKTPEERLHQSGESFKKAGRSFNRLVRNVGFAINNTLSGIGNIIGGTCLAIDAGDKKIGKGIEKRMKEKGKDTTGKFNKICRNNILKALLGVGILTYGGVEVSQQVKERHEDQTEISINDNKNTIKEIFENDDIIKDLKGSGKDLQEKWYNNYLGNNEAWNIMKNNFGIKERKKVIEGLCRMIESGDINMVFEKADEAGVPRQCIYLALTESGWQAGANSGVAGGYRQFTKDTAKSYGLIDSKGNDFRSDPEKSTEAAMKHLKDNYEQVTKYANKKKYNMSESDKRIFAFFMYNGSPNLVKAGIDACKGNVNEYSKELVNLAKKNNGKINGKKVDATQNAKYVPRILGMQDALEKIFEDNNYDIQKVRETENIIVSHKKTNADQMYEEYQKEMEGLTKSQKIKKLKEIKAQYDTEYKAKQISQKYHDGAIKVIDEDIENLENED